MKKGFIFTTDILLSLLVALGFFSGIIIFMSEPSTPQFSTTDLHQNALSALISLEANNTLRDAFSQNLTPRIMEFLNNATASNLCLNLTFLNDTFKIEQNHVKANCSRPNQIAIARRPLYAGERIRMVSLEAWYK
ncbi:MAG TPA: hypothetical protein VJB90_04190 [Candidatus Nanoarchaeia archaeon]|nr:hypothetical protein [Candidatus Nanoarchaeia archaeon]